mmetsp:Transcript_15621/g.33017  ORF Transcript_15621/g.33017 Transcript_15621/m.33017 type:complete len:392 (-) Transcript_15621:163-1338(-)
MCPGNPPAALRRRHKSSRFKFSSRNTNNNSVTFPMGESNDGNQNYSGIFHSFTTARTVLVIASILLVLSLLSLRSTANNYDARTRNRTLTDLTNTILDLTKQLQTTTEGRYDETTNDTNDDTNNQKIKAIKQQLIETQKALAKEERNLNSKMTDAEKLRETLSEQIDADLKHIEEYDRRIEEASAIVSQNKAEAEREEEENANLKIKLAFAIEELGNIREGRRKNSNHLRGGGASSRSRDGGGGSVRSELFKSGDNVEIFEYMEGGEVALRPAIILSVNTGGTYDMVQLDTGHFHKNVKTDQFRPYQILPEGQPALYQDSKIETGAEPHYVPVTIVQFVPDSSNEGHELHGRYQFRIDGDDGGSTTTAAVGEMGEIKEGKAAMIHRIERSL